MKKLIFVLSIITVGSSSFCSTNDSTIVVCGKIEDASNTMIILNRRNVFDSKQFFTQSDSEGNFYFKVDFDGINRYDLSIKSVNKIPLIVESGDSIYLSFNNAELKEYHDFLQKPKYSGKGANKNQHFYFLLKDRWVYQDSVKKLSGLNDPFEYRSVFLDKLDSEKKKIDKYFEKYPDLQNLKDYAIENNKYYWLSMATQYHEVKKGVDRKQFPKHLDSLGYFDFLKKYAPYSVGSENVEWFEFFINEYLFYLFFTKPGEFFFEMDTENQIDYIKNNTGGIVQKACLHHVKKRYVR
jgi:hypothetical protein